MITFNYWRGALLATICAGPVFVFPFFLMPIPPVGPGALFSGLIALFGISILFGAVIAFLPVFFGGYFMALWGSRNPRARHPVLWGIAGAALATPIGMFLTGLERGDPRFWALFAFTGAVCALLVRLGTRWDEPAPPAPLNAHQGEEK